MPDKQLHTFVLTKHAAVNIDEYVTCRFGINLGMSLVLVELRELQPGIDYAKSVTKCLFRLKLGLVRLREYGPWWLVA